VSNRSKRTLFDHLIGCREQRRRHGDAEHPSDMSIDNQLELGRLATAYSLRHYVEAGGLFAVAAITLTAE
jgi:hypothetical protein